MLPIKQIESALKGGSLPQYKPSHWYTEHNVWCETDQTCTKKHKPKAEALQMS